MYRIFPRIRATLFLLGLALSTQGLAGDGDITVDVQGGQDNTIYETDSGNLSNGMGQYLFAGRTGDDGGNRLRRALVRFNLNSIPAGATAQNVDFTFTVDREPMNGGAPPTTFTLHRMTADWGEGASDAPGSEGIGTIAQTGDATWLHSFFDTDFWNSEGGDFVGSASATMAVDNPGVYTFASNPSMLGDVQSWMDNPSTNFGWIILGGEGGSFNARRFASFQNPTAADRPTLTLTYSPPAGPPPAPAVIPTLGSVGLLLLIALLSLAAAVVLRRGMRKNRA